jgi:hypothetical protein
LQERIRELEAQLGQNSSNSTAPLFGPTPNTAAAEGATVRS